MNSLEQLTNRTLYHHGATGATRRLPSPNRLTDRHRDHDPAEACLLAPDLPHPNPRFKLVYKLKIFLKIPFYHYPHRADHPRLSHRTIVSAQLAYF